MTQCRECGVDVAENEEICPACGFPQIEPASENTPKGVAPPAAAPTAEASKSDEFSYEATLTDMPLVEAAPADEKMDTNDSAEPELDAETIAAKPVSTTSDPI